VPKTLPVVLTALAIAPNVTDVAVVDDTVPVRLPVTLPITLPVRLPVTLPVILPVIAPTKPFKLVTGPVKVVDDIIYFLFAQVAY
jgi:hypothetical protein